MASPEQKLLAIIRDLESVAGQLDPALRNAERGELMIAASRLRSTYQKLTSKSG